MGWNITYLSHNIDFYGLKHTIYKYVLNTVLVFWKSSSMSLPSWATNSPVVYFKNTKQMHFNTGLLVCCFPWKLMALKKENIKTHHNKKTPKIPHRQRCFVKKSKILWMLVIHIGHASACLQNRCKSHENLNADRGKFVWFPLVPHTSAKYPLTMSPD